MAETERIEGVVMDTLRRAGGPLRESVLFERVRAGVAGLEAERFLAVLERLATLGHLRSSVEHDLPARDPEPFQPRFWQAVR